MKKIFEEIRNLWSTLSFEYRVLTVLLIVAIFLMATGISDLISGYNPTWFAETFRTNYTNQLITRGWVKIGVSTFMCLVPFANYLYWNWRCRKAEKEIQDLQKKANRQNAEEAIIL